MQTLRELFINELKDAYDAENRLVTALPRMAAAATASDLREAFEEHLEETRGHVRRLDQIFNALGESPLGEKCEAMEGLLKECEQHLIEQGDPAVKDAALIACAQRVEHYEIAVYGTVSSYAKHLDLRDSQDLLHQTLTEEKECDKKLTKLAEGSMTTIGINKEARRK